jgi:hypothetical protein
MSENNQPLNFVLGFAEGLFSPVVELVVGILVGVGVVIASALSSAGAPNMAGYITLIFVVVVLVDILRNIISSFRHSAFAFGNVVGDVFGLVIFYQAIRFVSPESADYSLFWTGVMVVSLIIGCVVTGVRAMGSGRSDYYGY